MAPQHSFVSRPCPRLRRFPPPEQRLTDAQVERLFRIATYFGLHIERCGTQLLVDLPGLVPRHLVLPYETGLARVLAEVCSASTRWVSFGPRHPCEQYLFSLDDERLRQMGARAQARAGVLPPAHPSEP